MKIKILTTCLKETIEKVHENLATHHMLAERLEPEDVNFQILLFYTQICLVYTKFHLVYTKLKGKMCDVGYEMIMAN